MVTTIVDVSIALVIQSHDRLCAAQAPHSVLEARKECLFHEQYHENRR